MNGIYESKIVSFRVLQILRILFAIQGIGITIYTMLSVGIYVFAFWTNISIIVASIYFVFASFRNNFEELTGVIYSLAWSQEIGLLTFYWILKLLSPDSLHLPLWYDIVVHLTCPLAVVIDSVLSRASVQPRDFTKLCVVIIAYIFILFISTMIRPHPIYPNVTFDNTNTYIFILEIVAFSFLWFLIGVKIGNWRTKKNVDLTEYIDMQNIQTSSTN